MRHDCSLLRNTLVGLAIFSLAPIMARAQAPAAAPRITTTIDNTVRVQIAHSTHPLARPEFDTGRLEGGAALQRMVLILDGSPQQDHDLATFIDSQQSSGSPDYHHWLTPDEFGARFGPAPNDIAAVTNWLQQEGFGVDRVARSGKFIQFTGTSAQVEAAFQTEMHRYSVNGEAHIGNARDISIPAALASVVRGVASLNDFFPKPGRHQPALVRRASNGRYDVISTEASLVNQQGAQLNALAPGDFAAIYDLNPLYTAAPTNLNGSGVTISIIGLSDINLQDITDFRNVFGLPAPTATNPDVIVDGVDPGDVSGADIEGTIDTEWAGAVAPGAQIDFVISANTLVSPAIELSALYIVDQDLGQIINGSVGACEQALGTAGNQLFNALWQQAAAQGMSVFISTGDTGAAGCDPNAPVPAPGAVNGLGINGIGSTPYNTAVGGTEFNETGAGESSSPGTTNATFWSVNNSATFESALGYISEMVWNESCTDCISDEDSLGASGGGVSVI
jgi:subtilase family serine protease